MAAYEENVTLCSVCPMRYEKNIWFQSSLTLKVQGHNDGARKSLSPMTSHGNQHRLKNSFLAVGRVASPCYVVVFYEDDETCGHVGT